MQKIKKVVLVDDDEADNYYHATMIKRARAEILVHSIQDSRKAIECWQKTCSNKRGKNYVLPEFVFLDINMAVCNGFDLLDRIRKTPDPLNLKKRVKIFMLTTSRNPDDYRLALEKYDDLVRGYYFKPLTDKIFLEILDQYV